MDSFTAVPTVPPCEQNPENQRPLPDGPPPSYNQVVFSQEDKTLYKPRGAVYHSHQDGANVQPVKISRLPNEAVISQTNNSVYQPQGEVYHSPQNEDVQPVTVSRLPNREITNNDNWFTRWTPRKCKLFIIISVIIFIVLYLPHFISNFVNYNDYKCEFDC